MSDGSHLLIPFAASVDEGCAQALKALELPNMDKLLARLQPKGADEGDAHSLSMPHERALASLLGLNAPDGCLPWAAWQASQSGRDTQGAAWARITPCHWQVGQDHIAMGHPQQLGLSAEQSQALLAAMKPWFEEDGIALEYEAPTQWLARGEVFRGFASASLDRVIGRVIDSWLPRGHEARTIRRLQQEMQMLLYTNDVNEERALAGQKPVNSFWVSDAGALPDSHAERLPDELVVTNGLRDTALMADWNAWASAWTRIDETDCAALLKALARGEHVSLTLCGDRNARTFAGTGGGLFGKLASALRGSRRAAVLESL
ncbi:MAG TPA: phosphoglycerate mutase [Ramlibacter sp.]|nr:phosphoglycerate mutase [Ramlibacter sp.]